MMDTYRIENSVALPECDVDEYEQDPDAAYEDERAEEPFLAAEHADTLCEALGEIARAHGRNEKRLITG